MIFRKRDHLWMPIVITFFIAIVTSPIVAFAQKPCAVSPSVTGAPVLPNALMIADNSGSMLYAAYPNNYSNSTTYYGLFDPAKRYNYNSTNQYFEENTTGSWGGNFLNWATLTRWDVEIYVLTGQRYVDVSSQRFLVANPDDRWNDSSFNDHHWYDDTDDVTPNSSGTSLLYKAVPFYRADDFDGTITDNRWSYLQVYDGTSRTFFYLRLKVASDYQPKGLLHGLENKVRFGLMHFNGSSGGYIQRYIKKLDATELNGVSGANGVIPDLHRPLVDETSLYSNYIATTWTPLAETLYEATRYFRQVSPAWNKADGSGDYAVATNGPPASEKERDPFYFPEYPLHKVSCVKNYVLIVTDGEATQDREVPAQDDADPPRAVLDADGDGCDGDPCPADQAGCGYGAFSCSAYPFDDATNRGSAYLDDVAYYAQNNDMRADLTGDQKITTHTVFVFGSSTAPGAVLLSKTATNGKGMYKLATDASAITDALKQIFEQITQQAAAAASTAITSEPVSGTDYIYIPYYKHPQQDQWWGNIRAFKLDSNGHLINNSGGVAADTDGDYVLDNPIWDASAKLQPMNKNSRVIFTYISGSKVSFDTSNASTVGKYFDVDLNSNGAEESTEVTALFSYIRGIDDPGGYDTRDRSGFYLGDIMHASPYFVGLPSARFDLIYGDISYWDYYYSSTVQNRSPVLYAGSNDGMLHCFDASTDATKGQEKWAYIPYNLLPHLKWLADKTYCHCYDVDLSAKVWDIPVGDSWRSILLGGMRLGGTPRGVDTNEPADGTNDVTLRSSLFALDVTNPDSPQLLWEKNDDGTSDTFGYTFSKPLPVKVQDRWYLVFGSGPKSRDGEGAPATSDGYSVNPGYIFVVDPDNGTVLQRFDLGTSGTGNFFGSPAAVDYDLDYSVDMIYIGDAKGNLWRLKTFTGYDTDGSKSYAASPSGWAIDVSGAIGVPNPSPLLSLGAAQPILMKVEVAMDARGRDWIYMGTGRYFCANDNLCCSAGTDCPPGLVSGSCPSGNSCAISETINSISETRSRLMAVGIYDRHWYTDSDPTKSKFVLQDTMLGTGNLDQRVIITGQVAGNLSATGYAIVDATYPGQSISEDVCSTCQGWYFHLFEERERCLGDFLVYGGAVFFISYKPANDPTDPCTTGGTSYLYGVYYASGTSTLNPLFDLTGEGTIDSGDLVKKDGKTFGPAMKRLDRAFAGGSPKASGGNLYTPLPLKPEPIAPPAPTPQTGVTSWKEVLE